MEKMISQLIAWSQGYIDIKKSKKYKKLNNNNNKKKTQGQTNIYQELKYSCHKNISK